MEQELRIGGWGALSEMPGDKERKAPKGTGQINPIRYRNGQWKDKGKKINPPFRHDDNEGDAAGL